MNINVFALGFLALIAGYFAWSSYTQVGEPVQHFLPWVPIDVRKSKVYVSKNRDAGMSTERQRRIAIIGNRLGNMGSSNGYLDYGLTAICLCPKDVCPPAPNVVWDGGNATSEVCDIIDGGDARSESDAVDFGNALTNVCDV